MIPLQIKKEKGEEGRGKGGEGEGRKKDLGRDILIVMIGVKNFLVEWMNKELLCQVISRPFANIA